MYDLTVFGAHILRRLSHSSPIRVGLALAASSLLAASCVGVSADKSATDVSATLTLERIEVGVQLPLLSLASEMTVTAIGHYSDGSSDNITGDVEWSSGDPNVVALNEPGQALALAAGTAEIVATDPGTGLQGAAEVTVTAAELLSMSITPDSISLALGVTEQLAAIGLYSDGSEVDLTASVEWDTGDGALARVSDGGLLTALTAGTTVVSAVETVSGVSAELEITLVPAILVELAVWPDAVTLSLGLDTDLQVIGIFSDGTEVDLTAGVAFTADGVAASVDANGNVLGANVGATTVLVTDPDSGIETTVNVGVTNAVLQSLAVTNNPASLPLGLGQALTVIGTYSDGTEVDLTGAVQWASNDEAVATVSPGGVLGGAGLGNAEITAIEPSSAVSTRFDVSVTDAVLESLAILPGTLGLPLGFSTPLRAVGTYSDGGTADLTSAVSWDSDNGLIAAVTGNGTVAGIGLGSTTVRAVYGDSGIGAAVSVNVLDAVLQSITVTPANPNVVLGLTKQFIATGHFSDGSTANLNALVNWTSLNRLLAVALGNGLFSTLGVGDVTLRATDPATGIVGETAMEVCTLIILCD